jgi:hypothetical protein
MTTATTQRGKIVEAVRTMIETIGDAKDGTLFKKFRKVRRGAWVIGEAVRPSVVVVDIGSAKAGDNDQSDTTKVFKLSMQILVNLDADFGKTDAATDWSDAIETLKLSIQNFNPRCGCKNMNVTGDEPIRVEAMAGGAEHIWIIEAECEYFVEVGAFAGDE